MRAVMVADAHNHRIVDICIVFIADVRDTMDVMVYFC